LGEGWQALLGERIGETVESEPRAFREDEPEPPAENGNGDGEIAALEGETLWGERRYRWRGRGGLWHIRRDFSQEPRFDLAMKDKEGVTVQEFPSVPSEKLTDAWLNIKAQREKWAGAPYAPIFVTVDAVVRGDDRVLLIRRAREPGAGLWALPGGFVEQDERLLQAAMRELREETSIGLLQVSLEDAFRSSKVFDHPQRSLRGRTITHAHFFDLGRHTPDVQAADDAAEAQWVPIGRQPRWRVNFSKTWICRRCGAQRHRCRAPGHRVAL
jgi:ADP-ribose pyrophosphatase YjhB (NUDIX family)